MPAYRFSWEPFDDRTTLALAQEIGYRGAADGARAHLTAQVKRPDDDFVRTTKNRIAKVWLPQHPGVAKAIVRELFDLDIGPLGAMPDDPEGCGDYVARCRNSSRLRDLLYARLLSFGDADRGGDDDLDGDFVPGFVTVVPEKQNLPLRKAHAHQEAAWKAMDAHLRAPAADEPGVFKGVLVMPTGSGKTFTAVHWLVRRHIDEGGRVLWLAHREELLRQAARNFFELAGLASKRKSDRLRVRVVSTRHCRFHQIDPADDIVCCSVNSLARGGDEAKKLLEDPRLFVVIDEAHHAPAKSYRDAIHVLAGAASHRLLGLTATPTRTAEKERPELSRLFGKRVLFQVSTAELIAKELLARPIPASVRTEVDAEEHMSPEDREHLRDFNEPSSEMFARLGRDVRRNQVIVKQYLDNREKYGKTLVFTTDVEGAALLTHAFREKGVAAEYVASWRPGMKDGDRVDNRDILNRYRDPRVGGETIDVLVNVEMLTEGIDLPMTRTVFLARPTSSEVLLRQMVGRGLRGLAAGGNAEAHIVSFEDHWSLYRDYLSPIDLFRGDLPAPLEPPQPPPVLPPSSPSAEPPVSWDEIIDVAHRIRAAIADSHADVFEAVPHGMYVLDFEMEGQPVRRVIHVYEHQESCWQALLSTLASCSSAKLASLDPRDLEADLFGDVDPPAPASFDLMLVLERAKHGDPQPKYVRLEGRAACDPRELAKIAREKDLRQSELNPFLEERHSPLAKVIYPSLLDFRRAFDDAVRELDYPAAAPPPKGVVLFEPPPNNPLRPGPPDHDLRKLLAETLQRGEELLGRPLRHHGTVECTRHIIKGWYGMADILGPRRGRIRINVLLNSPDFSQESMRFLLWHEFLHVHLEAGHTEEFRRLERLWPNHAACQREMDALNEKFGVQYW